LAVLTVRAKRTLKTESSDGPTAAYGRPRPPGMEPDDPLRRGPGPSDLDDHEIEVGIVLLGAAEAGRGRGGSSRA
jgi:hypothetical protein